MKTHTFVLLLSMVVLISPALLAQPEPFSVRVSFGYTDPEPVQWTGSVTADQASITSLEGWLFLAVDSISFNTFEISAGGPVNKGLTITGSASSGGRLSILTDHGSFSVPVFSLRLGNPVSLLDGAARAERLPDAIDLSDGSGEDDYPSIAVGKDSTAWAVWQSYGDQFDEVRLAKYEDKWRTYTVLPGVSGDEIFQGVRFSSEHRGAPRAARSVEDYPGGYQEAGFLWNAYRKGYRLGTIASSDHHSTHISYAMVYTTQPTREAIFEGFRRLSNCFSVI